MHDYERQLKNGMWIAKRGYVYYLYNSMSDIKRDDEEVSHNLERINKGIEVFNRIYDGCWVFCSRRMSEVKEYATEREIIYES